MAKLNNIKVIKKFSNDDKNFQIIMDNNKKKLIKFFPKKKNNQKFINELNGYKFYSKNKIFNTPKLYSYSYKEKKLVIQYIDGEKSNPLHFKKIINKISRHQTFNINVGNYINMLKKNYSFGKNSHFFLKEINKYIPNNKKILTSNTHGDFSNFNCLKFNKSFYVIDFEKFSKRIVLFDNLNWYLQYLFFNIAKVFNYKFSSKTNNFFFRKSINFIHNIVKILNKDQIKNLNIKSKDLNIYFLFYYFEKILILENDLKNIMIKKNKKITKNLINLLMLNTCLILNEYKK